MDQIRNRKQNAKTRYLFLIMNCIVCLESFIRKKNFDTCFCNTAIPFSDQHIHLVYIAQYYELKRIPQYCISQYQYFNIQEFWENLFFWSPHFPQRGLNLRSCVLPIFLQEPLQGSHKKRCSVTKRSDSSIAEAFKALKMHFLDPSQ